MVLPDELATSPSLKRLRAAESGMIPTLPRPAPPSAAFDMRSCAALDINSCAARVRTIFCRSAGMPPMVPGKRRISAPILRRPIFGGTTIKKYHTINPRTNRKPYQAYSYRWRPASNSAYAQAGPKNTSTNRGNSDWASGVSRVALRNCSIVIPAAAATYWGYASSRAIKSLRLNSGWNCVQ